MSKFLTTARKVITAPIRGLIWLLNLPARSYRGAKAFMEADPAEHPLGELITDLVQDREARQVFWDQIEILRRHLLRSLLALIVGVGVALVFTPQFVNFLAQPIGGLSKLVAIDVTESLSVYMDVALLAGVTIASPYIAFELWAFVAPGLHPRERLYGLVGIPLAGLFFVTGLAFTFYVMLPGALPWLLNVLGFQARLRPSSYFSFVTGLMFWTGASFEYPLVIFVLTAMGVVKPKLLAEYWRQAVVAISIIAAVITPTWDPVNMGLVMLPMVLLYFVSMGLSYLAYAGRSKPAPAKAAERGTG